MDVPVGRWFAGRLFIYGIDHIVSKFRLKNGAYVFYLPKLFSVPWSFVIIIDKKLVSEMHLQETVIRGRCDKTEGTYGYEESRFVSGRCIFKAYKLNVAQLNGGVYVMRVNRDRRSLEVLKPNRPTTPKYDVIMLVRDVYRATGYTRWVSGRAEPEPVLELYNNSASGGHWAKAYLWILPLGGKARLTEYRLTGRDNSYTYVIDVSAERVVVARTPRYYISHEPIEGVEPVCELTPEKPYSRCR